MTSLAEDLDDRLTPKHLMENMETAADIQKRLETKENPQEIADRKLADDPRANEQYTFNLNYMDGRGKVWTGEFTTKILNAMELTRAGQFMGIMAAPVPYRDLDPLAQEVVLMRANLQLCLVKKPKWAEKLEEIRDITIMQAVYSEVDGHKAYFHKWGTYARQSAPSAP